MIVHTLRPISVATMEVHPHAFVCIDFNTALATRTRDTYGVRMFLLLIH